MVKRLEGQPIFSVDPFRTNNGGGDQRGQWQFDEREERESSSNSGGAMVRGLFYAVAILFDPR